MEQNKSNKDLPKGTRIQSLMEPMTAMNMQEENSFSPNSGLTNVHAFDLDKVSESGEDGSDGSTVVQSLRATSPVQTEKTFPEAVLMFDRDAVSEREKIRKILEKKGIFDFIAKLLIPLEGMESDDPVSLVKSNLVNRLQQLDPVEYTYAHLERTRNDLLARVKQLTRELEEKENLNME